MKKFLLSLALCSTYLCAGYIQDRGTSPDGSLTVVINDSWFGQATTVNVYNNQNTLVAHFPGNAASFNSTSRLLAVWHTNEPITHIYEAKTWEPILICDRAVENISDVFRGQDPVFIAGDEIIAIEEPGNGQWRLYSNTNSSTKNLYEIGELTHGQNVFLMSTFFPGQECFKKDPAPQISLSEVELDEQAADLSANSSAQSLDDMSAAGCGLSHRMRTTLSEEIDC